MKRCLSTFRWVAALAALATTPSQAQVLYATGQNNGDPTHATGNYIYTIDPWTGAATPISPVINTSPPAGLAGLRDGRLLGFRNGHLVEINPNAGAWSNLGNPTGVTATSLDVLSDGRGYLMPLVGGQTQQLHQIDLTTGTLSAIGTPGAVGHAIEAALGNAPGTARPFVISLGSVGRSLYGVDLSTDSLLHLNPDTGAASLVGAVGAVDLNEQGRYSGYAALSGVDLNQDGEFDTLFGVVNFFDPDGPGPASSQRLGGLARYDLNAGTWSLVGSNPGLIFFGLGSSPTNVPEPGALALLSAVAAGLVSALRQARKYTR
jgi:hypothetical protein